jgi:hypothetical protein
MSALDELRENLREAAQRDIAATRVRRRRKRRATGLIALALIGGTAVAGAADLISVGGPSQDPRDQGSDAYKPPPGTLQPTILATAESGRELPYAVGVYTANNGLKCLVAGSLRGYTLGREKDGTFQPYRHDTVGSCREPERGDFAALPIDGRTLVYGRVTPKYPKATITVDGDTISPPVQKGGGFLVVYDGNVRARAIVRIPRASN